jgi:hypothetical protein
VIPAPNDQPVVVDLDRGGKLSGADDELTLDVLNLGEDLLVIEAGVGDEA